MQGFGKHLSGAKVPHNKHTSACATEEMPVPARVVIPMAQSIGAACTPLVKKGDAVKVGQKIGDSEAFFSVPVHSSVSGTVASVDDFVTAFGAVCQAVVIDTDGEQTVSEEVRIPEYEGKEAFLREVRNSGLVGLGGAAFPTFIKLNPKNPDEVNTLIVNAAECEPYITSDLRAMLEDTELLIAGIRRIVKELGFKKVIIGIEDNKPEAVAVLKPYCDDRISLCILPSKYPKGGEKVLIYEATGKVVAEGQLPADVGVIVMNVTSVIVLETYFETGMPLVGKRVTIDGGAVAEPKNIRAPIGTLYSDLIAFCGGYKEKPAMILQGGPMMGIAVPNDSQPLLKNNNAVLALTAKECEAPESSPCIRCGRCLRACPFGLMPAAIDRAARNRDADQLRKLKVNLCMECGCCSYVCPASRPLVQQNKLGKQILKNGGGK